MHEVSYLDKTSKLGACELCLPELIKASHELLPIMQTVTEVAKVLRILEDQVGDLAQSKKHYLGQHIDRKKIIEADSQAFAYEQTNRIN